MHTVARALVGMAVLALAACGNAPTGARGEPPVDVAALVGTWSVTGTGGPDALLILEPRAFELRYGPDVRWGTWRADPAGPFVAHVSGGSAEAVDSPADLSTPPWLASASTVVSDGADRVLRDTAGAVTARLTPAGPAPALRERLESRVTSLRCGQDAGTWS